MACIGQPPSNTLHEPSNYSLGKCIPNQSLLIQTFPYWEYNLAWQISPPAYLPSSEASCELGGRLYSPLHPTERRELAQGQMDSKNPDFLNPPWMFAHPARANGGNSTLLQVLSSVALVHGGVRSTSLAEPSRSSPLAVLVSNRLDQGYLHQTQGKLGVNLDSNSSFFLIFAFY